MKITGPIKPGAAASTKKAQRKPGAGGGAFARALESGAASHAEKPKAVVGAAPVAAIEALLALQGVSDEESEGRRQALARGHQLLDLLEEVRRGILLGVIPEATLRRLAQLARAREGQRFTDPRLAEILAEIELRAEVELAKIERERAARNS